GHNLLQDTENEVIGNAQLSILSGNDAIYAISKEISETYKNLSTSLEKRREIYYRHSNYLRHFFDFTLTMLEYIDTRKVLNQKQKQEYVDLVVESASYDESMLWVLLQTDYDESKRKTKPQIDRLNDLDLKYDIMRRLVFQEVNENNEVIK
ncbi:MAG: hypothetical protein JNJ85_05205, partial [Candidatus Kapabacteria bacterium]|nr:hypothetical protein [Candidatus Kapabacteria bacterium]